MIQEILEGKIELRKLSEKDMSEDVLLDINYEFYEERLNQLDLLIGYEKISYERNTNNDENDLLSVIRKKKRINLYKSISEKIHSRLRYLAFSGAEYMVEN